MYLKKTADLCLQRYIQTGNARFLDAHHVLRGRPRQAGKRPQDDRGALARMAETILNGEAKNEWAAAGIAAHEFTRYTQSEKATRKRLYAKFIRDPELYTRVAERPEGQSIKAAYAEHAPKLKKKPGWS